MRGKKFLIGVTFVFITITIANPVFARKIELTFWHSLGFHVKAIIEELTDEYNSTHKGVKVTPVFQGLFEDMQVKMLASAVTHQLPDVAQVQLEFMEPYIYNGIIDPINKYIPETEREDIIPQFWDLVTRDGEIYGVPFCISTQVFFYNEDAFKMAGLDPNRPPDTWEEMIEMSKKLTMDTNGDGKIDRYAAMFWLNGIYGIAPFLWDNGGKIFSDDGKKVNLTSDAMVKTVQMLKDLVYKYEIMPRNWTDWESGQAFLQGKLAMGGFTSAAISYGEKNLPWKLRISLLPKVNGNRYTVLGGSTLVNFSRSRKKRKAANDFIFWLVNKENTIKMHEEVGFIPIRKSALNSLELRMFDKKNPNFKVPIESIKYGRALPNHPEFYKINKTFAEMLQRIILNNGDVLEELQKTEKEINSFLE